MTLDRLESQCATKCNCEDGITSVPLNSDHDHVSYDRDWLDTILWSSKHAREIQQIAVDSFSITALREH